MSHLATEHAVLCMGGSLLGVAKYRELLIDQLARFGLRFARTVFVQDPAVGGAQSLAGIFEESDEHA